MDLTKSFGSIAGPIAGTLAGLPWPTYAKYFGTAAVIVLGWEHIGRKQKTKIRPSVGLTWTSDKSQKGFKWLGEQAAWISSYLTQIDLKEFGVTIHAVGKPMFDLISSPFYAVAGYVGMAASYANKEWLIYSGSALLVGALTYAYYLLGSRYPTLDIWTPVIDFVRTKTA